MKVVDKNGKRYVFDEIRKKYLVLTPEEIVRQQVIHFLTSSTGYPKASISVEKAISLHGKNRRYDIVVYAGSQPWLIVECKAASVKISQETFDQIGHYNMALKVPYLYITNGEQHYVLEVDASKKTYDFLDELPVYPDQG